MICTIIMALISRPFGWRISAKIVTTSLYFTFLMAAQSGLGHYWHKITDRTFSGVYHANGFDLAMMIPYFIVLFILALYGLHRYWLVYDYYRYAKNVPAVPAAGCELAAGYDSTADLQRALRDRAAGGGDFAV